jgi:hypothetical protein
MPTSLQQSRLGINMVLTNLAQGVIQPDYAMRLLYPLAEVADYGGQIIEFDDSAYLEVDDDRADDTPYPEIQESYFGRPFTLNTKGLSFRVGDKKANQMQRLGINWGRRASERLIGRAGLMHEIEAASAATTVGNYATTNRITLSAGSQFNESGVDPDPVIRTGKSAVASQIGVDPNVMVMGRDVYDVLAARYSRNFTATSGGGGLRPQLTEEILAGIFGFARVRVCNALRKTASGRQRIFGKHIVMGYTNPAALNADRLPYRPQGQIDVETPSYGYTYVYVNNPLMYNPYRDEDRGATVYKLDFDRKVTQTGVDRTSGLITHGYLIANAVA